jgi:OOP family OmpA-OmpF porin
MKSFFKYAASWMVVTLHFAVFAQSGTILRESEISEVTLIEALMPSPPSSTNPEAASAMGRTRSFRVTKDDQTPHATSPKAAAASLLITFETSSATLTPRAKQSLDIVARALKSDNLAPYRFSIEGHADPTGNEGANLELSRVRAESVAMYLSQQHQVERTRLSTVGKGQAEVINLTKIDAPENRRVTIKTLVQ